MGFENNNVSSSGAKRRLISTTPETKLAEISFKRWLQHNVMEMNFLNIRRETF